MTDETKLPRTVTIEEYEALQATNARILDEHRGDKVRFKSRLSEFEEKENSALEKKNDFKTLHEQLSKKNDELTSELTNVRYSSFEKNLALEVNRLAKDAHNPTAIMRALSVNADNTDLESGTLRDLSSQIDHLRKEESYLFAQTQTNQTNNVPRFNNQSSSTEKTMSEMSQKELEAAIKNYKQ